MRPRGSRLFGARGLALAGACGLLFLAGGQFAWAQTRIIKLGTVAPEGSPWHDVLLKMGQDWSQKSGGQVKLRIYPGGALGDELQLVYKMRNNQLQAVAMSGVGLHHVEPGVSCLQIPMMYASYEELDYVRDRIAPRLERSLGEKGYLVLNWGDAGWVRFFSKSPARRPDDIRKMKLFIAAGDSETMELYKAVGARPVPLPETEMLTSLQTGLIDAFDVPPLLALFNQWFGVAKHMLDVKWAPVVGATLIRRSDWEKIPGPLRPSLLAAAQESGRRFRDDVRRLSEDAIGEMEKRGLKVERPDAASVALWQAEAEKAYPRLRGEIIPADLFDEVRRLRDEYRAQKSAR